jgi:hypothetical protein
VTEGVGGTVVAEMAREPKRHGFPRWFRGSEYAEAALGLSGSETGTRDLEQAHEAAGGHVGGEEVGVFHSGGAG